MTDKTFIPVLVTFPIIVDNHKIVERKFICRRPVDLEYFRSNIHNVGYFEQPVYTIDDRKEETNGYDELYDYLNDKKDCIYEKDIVEVI